ncbi:unnamed protein product [Caenorhabditis brenneri]
MLYQEVHVVLSALGVVINGLTLILALTKSPRIMRLCAVIIAIKTTTDIMASVMNAFTMSRIVTDGNYIFIISTGYCTSIGPTACYSGHMFYICFLECNLIWMISSYIFRYYILYVKDPKRKTIQLTAFCLITPCFFHMTAWISFFERKTDVIPFEKVGLEPGNLFVLGGTVVYYSTITLFIQLFITGILVVCSYFWIRGVLINYSQNMGAISRETKNLNKLLVKIITFQVFLPSFIFMGVFLFFIQFFNVYHHVLLEYSISIVFMLSPILSPFSYLLFVPHYRNFFLFKRTRSDSTTSLELRAMRMRNRTTRIIITSTSGTVIA